MAEAGPLRRVREALRSRTGRKILLVLLLAGMALLAWRYVARMPSAGVVELRWTESPPAWVSISYIDEDGQVVRLRRQEIRPGADRFRDAYRLAPATYWVRLEFRQADGVHAIRKRVDLPTVQPIVFFAEESAPPSPEP
jgi:hypothetical protein